MICSLGFFPQVSPSLAATPGIPSGQGVLPCGSLPPKTPCLVPAPSITLQPPSLALLQQPLCPCPPGIHPPGLFCRARRKGIPQDTNGDAEVRTALCIQSS